MGAARSVMQPKQPLGPVVTTEVLPATPARANEARLPDGLIRPPTQPSGDCDCAGFECDPVCL